MWALPLGAAPGRGLVGLWILLMSNHAPAGALRSAFPSEPQQPRGAKGTAMDETEQNQMSGRSVDMGSFDGSGKRLKDGPAHGDAIARCARWRREWPAGRAEGRWRRGVRWHVDERSGLHPPRCLGNPTGDDLRWSWRRSLAPPAAGGRLLREGVPAPLPPLSCATADGRLESAAPTRSARPSRLPGLKSRGMTDSGRGATLKEEAWIPRPQSSTRRRR
jgi:hypothetical protein